MDHQFTASPLGRVLKIVVNVAYDGVSSFPDGNSLVYKVVHLFRHGLVCDAEYGAAAWRLEINGPWLERV